MKKYLLLILILLLLTSCKTKELKEEYPKFVSKCYETSITLDGWFEFFCIEASKKNAEIKDTLNNYELGNSTTYTFDGYNLKYKTLDGYYIPIYDENNIEISKVEPMYPSYSTSKEKRSYIKLINNYFNEKKFKNKIDISDLKDLNIDDSLKDKLVLYFNNAFDSEPSNLGEYTEIPVVNIVDSLIENNYYFRVGYYIEYGNIKKINIEIIYKDKYLENINESHPLYSLYKNTKEVEKWIIDNQSFDISKYENYSSDLEILNDTLKGIIS